MFKLLFDYLQTNRAIKWRKEIIKDCESKMRSIYKLWDNGTFTDEVAANQANPLRKKMEKAHKEISKIVDGKR